LKALIKFNCHSLVSSIYQLTLLQALHKIIKRILAPFQNMAAIIFKTYKYNYRCIYISSFC